MVDMGMVDMGMVDGRHGDGGYGDGGLCRYFIKHPSAEKGGCMITFLVCMITF